MLKEVTPPGFEQIFCLQMVSSSLKSSQYAFSLKRQQEYTVLCVKTMQLKFSIMMFQSCCLEQVRSFTLHAGEGKEISFLNLEIRSISLEEERQEYQVLVGYQNGDFDIYKIVGENSKLIQSSRVGKAHKMDIIGVQYQIEHRHIVLVNKNMLFSIQQSSPFRLQREQEIKPVICCDISSVNVIVGRLQGIDIHQVMNFKKLKTINMACISISRGLDNVYYVGTANNSLCLVSQDGETKKEFSGFNSLVCQVIEQEDMLWMFSCGGELACVSREDNLTVEENQQSQINPTQRQQSQRKETEQIRSEFDCEGIAQLSQRNEQSEVEHSNQHHSQKSSRPVCPPLQHKDCVLKKTTKFYPYNILSVRMEQSLIFIIDNTGVVSIQDVKPPQK